jgi:predicted enzyme related to lactoylglutathione lyase
MAKPKATTKKPAAKTKTVAKPAKKKVAAKPAKKAVAKKPAPTMDMGISFGQTALLPVLTGLRSVIYKVTDIDVAKKFYQSAVGKPPYFDQPFYVGFDLDGQEVGLDPDTSKFGPGPGGAVAYWKVVDIHAVYTRLTSDLGGASIEEPADVGGGIQVAVVGDPFGNLVGLIQMS